MEALSALKWLFLVIIGIFLVSFFVKSSGGISGSFIRPLSPIGSGINRGGSSLRQGDTNNNSSGSAETDDIEEEVNIADIKGSFNQIQGLANSKYKDIVSISSYSQAKNTDPNKERIEIRVKRGVEGKIVITNWRLESAVTGGGDNIEGGSYLPYSARVNPKNQIALEAGDKAVIVTGRSPIGVSFQINKCIGYFEQFQDFEPSLSRSCPDPVDDLPNLGVGDLANACFDFIDRLPRCEIYLDALPGNLGGFCLNYINQKINYNSCVDTHKDDSGFYTGEWRVYLERDQELWKKKREIIKLLDEEGKIVDVITY